MPWNSCPVLKSPNLFFLRLSCLEISSFPPRWNYALLCPLQGHIVGFGGNKMAISLYFCCHHCKSRHSDPGLSSCVTSDRLCPFTSLSLAFLPCKVKRAAPNLPASVLLAGSRVSMAVDGATQAGVCPCHLFHREFWLVFRVLLHNVLTQICSWRSTWHKVGDQ